MVDEKPSTKTTQDDAAEKKSKFVFKCTRCGDCCVRGNIPLTFWDLELWAKKKVVANMFPHLGFVTAEKGIMDLVIKAVPLEEKTETEKKESDKSTTSENKDANKEKDTNTRCPLYRASDKTCLIYEDRPIFCREFPLDYDGKAFSLFEEPDCTGVGQGTMTKEQLQQIRDDAKGCYGELRRMRISLPILHQIISQSTIKTFLEQIARDSEERMKNLSDEDRKKMEDIYGKMGKSEKESEK